jgi:hypothetical protein
MDSPHLVPIVNLFQDREDSRLIVMEERLRFRQCRLVRQHPIVNRGRHPHSLPFPHLDSHWYQHNTFQTTLYNVASHLFCQLCHCHLHLL